MSMDPIRWSIGGVDVRPGVVIKGPMTSDRMFGQLIEPGARCESVQPQAWTPVVCAGGSILWEGETQSDYDRADAAARTHARQRIDEHLRSIFG